ncbi:hypothetical protein Trydic_g18802 [Trypoxylus dichotomus]
MFPEHNVDWAWDVPKVRLDEDALFSSPNSDRPNASYQYQLPVNSVNITQVNHLDIPQQQSHILITSSSSRKSLTKSRFNSIYSAMNNPSNAEGCLVVAPTQLLQVR